MRVPDEAASTKAKVTLSFPDWKSVNIAPSKFELAVVDITLEQEAKEKQDQRESLERLIKRESLERFIKMQREIVKSQSSKEIQEQFEEQIRQLEKQLEELKKP